MDGELEKRIREALRDSLLNVSIEVGSLLDHLNASSSERMALSSGLAMMDHFFSPLLESAFSAVASDEGVKHASGTLTPRDRMLLNMGSARRFSEQALANLEEGIETSLVAVMAMECERLVKQTAGWCLGVELGNTKAEISARSIAARNAGLASGKVRREIVKCKPETVQKQYRLLMATGTEERNIAAKLATRFNVTPNHIRKLRKQAINQT